MAAFYRHLPTTDAAEALALAQRELMADEAFADPYYWAPFVLLGNDRVSEGG